MTMQKTRNCRYRYPHNNIYCTHKEIQNDTGYCYFHYPLHIDGKIEPDNFIGKLKELEKNKEENWVGFEFPEQTKIFDYIFSIKINSKYSKSNNLYISGCTFNEHVDFSFSIFFGPIEIHNCIFKKGISFSFCTFESKIQFNPEKVDGKILFNNCQFNGKSFFTGIYNDEINFNHSSFYEASNFRGGLNIYSNGVIKNNQLFYNIVNFTEVDLRLPKKIKFSNVDLSKTLLLGTDMRGVQFNNVNFYQPTLKRQGLYDEVRAKKANIYKRELNNMEAAYRNLRITLEENKDFSTATDFYIGEMEARRQQKNKIKRNIFSIEAIYKILSLYGGNTLRAVTILLLVIIVHFELNYYFSGYDYSANSLNLQKNNFIFTDHPVWATIKYFGILFINSLDILIFNKGFIIEQPDGFHKIVDSIFRILAPIQLTLIIMSLRGRIKRH